MHFKKSVLKNHLLYSIITLMAIAMLFPITAFAQAYVQTWDLVDSGKHLDYDGNSTYMSYINTGAATWNAYKSGVIRKDSAFVVEDVYVSDVNASNGWAGMTYSSGKIELNTYYMSGYSNSKKQNVATHELGHALGLDHSTSTDVMDAAITGHTSTQALSQNDKYSYDAAYNNY